MKLTWILSRCETLRFVVSNTTEAGIVYHDTDKFEEKLDVTFPAKLTQFLYERYNTFNGAEDKGLVMLPVELIDDNGIELKKCVNKYIDLWNLPAEFKAWVNDACIFTSTLVDRIVTGYPKKRRGKDMGRTGIQRRPAGYSGTLRSLGH